MLSDLKKNLQDKLKLLSFSCRPNNQIKKKMSLTTNMQITYTP